MDTRGAGVIQVILLNGGSSPGKTTIAACLQAILPGTWLRLGADTLIDALPRMLPTEETGLTLGSAGSVSPGREFQQLETAWMTGIAAMAQAGAHIIVEDVFVSGVETRNKWQAALAELAVLWVGVRCDAAVAAVREQERGDRITGM